MHLRILLPFTFVSLISLSAFGQSSAAPKSSSEGAAPARTEVYHVHFNRAAPGKASALVDFFKSAASDPATNGHVMLLQHEDGAAWDYVTFQHMGPKTTVEAAGNPRGAAMKGLSAWHDDTFVNGPSWEQFAKAMGLDDQGKANSANYVYVVSTYRALPGHEDALEKFLSQPPSASNDLAVGSVLMQHLEGAGWRYLALSRYKSWQDFATSEATSVAQTAKGQGGWFTLREHISLHEDTLAFRVAP